MSRRTEPSSSMEPKCIWWIHLPNMAGQNYKPFKRNKLIRKKGIIIESGINEYGMKLIETK